MQTNQSSTYQNPHTSPNPGAPVPALEQARALRSGAGIWMRTSHTLVRITGPDAATWLQTQSSNDVLALEPGEGHANALLDRKAKLQAHFTLHRWEDEYWLLVERGQVGRLLEQFDAHLFIEQVEVADAGDELEQVSLEGPRSAAVLMYALDRYGGSAPESAPAAEYACGPMVIGDVQSLAFRVSGAGEDGYVFVCEKGQGPVLRDRLLEAGAGVGAFEPDGDALEILRVEAGIPRFGLDMDSGNRLPETTLERHAVSYTKGCYLGQEVVAKLKTYSAVKYGLMGLVFAPGSVPPPPGTPVWHGETKAGETRSAVVSAVLERPIALAYLERSCREPGMSLQAGQLGARRQTAAVQVLPFHEAPDRERLARMRYEDALDRFEQDADDVDDTAIMLLREAVMLQPAFEDAYEALGVILNRHGRVDEAIHYMKKLERLNPDCVMAHTNLSVFYMTKGLITEAEEEKAKAALLELRQASQARKAEDIARAERERIRREAEERLAMFEEVLEIDPDDALATFGAGMCYLQLDQADRAIPYFVRATQVQKDYSAAFLNLGKCHESLGHIEEARNAYRQGIAVASRKGDLMPMREMERRLKGLETSE